MRTHAERLLALGFESVKEGTWKHPNGRVVQEVRSLKYRYDEMRPSEEPKVIVIHCELRRANDTISGHIESIIRWLESDEKENQ